MTGRRRLSAALLLVGVAACSGGGGGPPLSPPPPPPPPPPPVTLQLSGAGVTYDAVAGDYRTTGPQQPALSSDPTARQIYVRVTDPDAPTATRSDQLVLDGDETIEVFFSHPGPHPAMQYVGRSFTSGPSQGTSFTSPSLAFAGTTPRTVGSSRWTTTRTDGATNVLTAYRLEEGAPATIGDYTDHVTLFEARSPIVDAGAPAGGWNTGAFVTVGTEIALSNMPSTGSATYRGEALGYYFDHADADYFLADMTLNANFGVQTGSVAGLIDNPHYQSGAVGLPNFAIAFTADRPNAVVGGTTYGGSRFSTGDVTVTGVGAGWDGFVTGSFFGPSSPDEVGGTFTVQDPSGQPVIAGGFVGGR